MDTPSIRLYLKIQEMRETEQIIKTLDEARNELNQSYMNVRRHYKSVQHQIVMKT